MLELTIIETIFPNHSFEILSYMCECSELLDMCNFDVKPNYKVGHTLFFYKNKLYKNTEPQIWPKNKNKVRTMMRLTFIKIIRTSSFDISFLFLLSIGHQSIIIILSTSTKEVCSNLCIMYTRRLTVDSKVEIPYFLDLATGAPWPTKKI